MPRSLLLLCAALLSAPAAASQIHYQDVTLKEAVRGASVIVVAEVLPAVPGQVRAPFRVVRVLKDAIAMPKARTPPARARHAPGERIEVEPANYRNGLWLAEVYRRTGIRRSPIYPRYPTGVPRERLQKRGEKVILLLGHDEHGLRFAVEGGYEDLRREGELKKLIRAATR